MPLVAFSPKIVRLTSTNSNRSNRKDTKYCSKVDMNQQVASSHRAAKKLHFDTSHHWD